MPELPEVETVVRLIKPKVVGRVFGRARFFTPRQLAPQTPLAVARALKGERITNVRRRGKYILIEHTGGTLLVHLRMTGRLYVRPASRAPLPHERAVLELDDGREALVFHDPRSLGTIQFYPTGAEIAPLLKMGWEPLETTIDLKELRERLSRRQTAIKPLLLDQTLWAGIGNIYASEALWEAGIDPRKPAGRLTKAELTRLVKAVVDVLTRAVTFGGTTIADFRNPDGGTGLYYNELRVYDRAGEACLRCGHDVERIVQAQRSTYFCRV